MHRWFVLPPEELRSPGDFLETAVEPEVTLSLPSNDAFIDELADRVLTAYVSEQPTGGFISLYAAPPELPAPTKSFFRRLFGPAGEPTDSWGGKTSCGPPILMMQTS